MVVFFLFGIGIGREKMRERLERISAAGKTQPYSDSWGE